MKIRLLAWLLFLLNNVPYKIHLYEKGGHGYGMINPTSDVKWMDLVEQWIKDMDRMKKR